MSRFKIGIGQSDYTPKPGLPIMGHLRDDYIAKGVHDPLYCKAVVLAGSTGTQAALVSLDICMLNRSQVAFMRKLIEKKCGIPQKNILIAATHTHGAAATMKLYNSPRASDSDIEEFLTKAVQAVVIAKENLKETNIAVGYSKEDKVSFNRRLKCKNGKTCMNWEELDPNFVVEPLGPTDPTLTVVGFMRNNSLAAVLVNFALHPAIIDYLNNDYTADFPGYLSGAMKRNFGDDFITMYFNGCCGDVNHINYKDENTDRRGFVVSERIGCMLAVSAVKAVKSQQPVSVDEIKISSDLVTLERFKISEQLYQQARDYLQKNETSAMKNTDGLPVQYCAPVWVDMYEKQNQDDCVEVMVIRLGDIAFVGLPGEVFCELGLKIKQNSPAKHTVVIELANDSIGYLPTSKAFDEGGYEVTPGATMYQKSAGEKIVTSAIEQLSQLFNK